MIAGALNGLERLGHAMEVLCDAVYDGCAFLGATIKAVVTSPVYLLLAVDQFHRLIVRSLPLVATTAASAGAVLALQFGLGMARFGGGLYVPTVVAMAI